MKLPSTVFALFVAVLIAASARAAEKFDPAAAAKEIAPFIDSRTLLVARLDVARVDAPALITKAGELIALQAEGQDVKTADRIALAAALAAAKLMAVGRQDDLLKAGATRIYAVVTLAEFPPQSGDDLVFLVAPGADNAKLQAVLKQWAENFGGDVTWEIVKEAVVVGSARTRARLKTMKPAERPELARAFEAAGDSALQVLLLPDNDTRRAIEELLPALPQDFGGIPSKTLTRGMLRASAGLDLPPAMALRITAQSEDAATAQALAKYATGLPEMLLKIEGAGDETLRAAIRAMIPLLKPKADGDRVTLSLDQKQLDAVIAQVAVPMLREARESAMAAQRINVARQICSACIVYANDHKNEWPDSLQQLVDVKALPAALVVDPATGKPAFIYSKPAVPMNKLKNPGETVIVYQAFEKWPGRAAVGYADGHVEFVADEALFKKVIAPRQ